MRQGQNSSVVNANELRVVGMSRSGNHAIINWMLQQVQGRYCFLNCADPGSNPFRTARPLDAGRPYRTNAEDFDFAREQAGDFSRKDYLLHSYEDCFLGMVADDRFEERHDAFVGSSARRLNVLILRDPFNLFASRVKSGLYRDREREGHNLVTRRTAVRIWKQHARAFAGERAYFPQPPITVSYNRWARDRGYRRALAEALGLAFTDAGFQQVPRAGGGSSFDGRALDGEAGRMDVLQRWRHFEDEPAFQALFDEEMVRFSENIFGSIPGTERLLSKTSKEHAG